MAFDQYGSKDKAKLNPSESSSSRINGIISLIEGLQITTKKRLEANLNQHFLHQSLMIGKNTTQQ